MAKRKPNVMHNMTNMLKMRNALSEDDWSSMTQDAYALKEQGKHMSSHTYLFQTNLLPYNHFFNTSRSIDIGNV